MSTMVKQMTPRQSVTAALSAWEFVAITTGWIPTLSDMVKWHPVAGSIVVSYAAYHFLAEQVDEDDTLEAWLARYRVNLELRRIFARSSS